MTEEQGNEEASTSEESQSDTATQEQSSNQNAVVPEPQKDDENPWADPDKARREIERLRRENGDARINAKKAAADEARQQLLESITAVLDPEAAQNGKPLSVEEVSAKLDAASAARDAAVFENRLLSESWKHNINPDKMDYLRFVLSKSDTLKSVNVQDSEFSAILESAIAEAVSKDPTLKAVGTAKVSGAETFSGSESGATITKAQFDSMAYVDRAKLFQTDRSTYDRLNAER